MTLPAPIRVFIGTDPRMSKANVALEHSIRANTRAEVEFNWMMSGSSELWQGWDIGREAGRPYCHQGWATDFTCFRFAIPEACGFLGRAIYLDADMICLGDIAELMQITASQPVLTTPRGYDVILFDCQQFKLLPSWPRISRMKSSGWGLREYHSLLVAHRAIAPVIPPVWNCCDGWEFRPDQTRLVHFTEMHTQPWRPYEDVLAYRPHPRPDMVALWNHYYNAACSARGTLPEPTEGGDRPRD